MSIISAIIYAVMAAGITGTMIAYLYERQMRRDAEHVTENLSDRLESVTRECAELRAEIARMDGVAQGRECDAMQRRFLESLQENGQGTVRIGRRERDA